MMNRFDEISIGDFLRDYPGMAIVPGNAEGITIKGLFEFIGSSGELPEIKDSFNIEIFVPKKFPEAIPIVKECEGKRIPPNGSFHVNEDSQTFCLGSPLRVLDKISLRPDLVGFAENCLVPYLYAVSNKLQNGGSFIFGDLAHGYMGVVNDYMDIFGLNNRQQVIKALKRLGMKKRLANKKPCPCECGLPLGRCPMHHKINQYRKTTSRPWIRFHAKQLEDYI